MNKLIIFWISIWLFVVGSSLYWNIKEDNSAQVELGLQSARAFFKQIVLDRSWNAGHGGVYVPITKKVQPNPYLDDPLRDVTTTDGLKLTKINPAFMTRQIAELAQLREGVKFHITSLNPIRPANKATEWEAESLDSFSKGAKEKFVVSKDANNFQLKYMAPLYTKEGCLKCHSKQGYKVGDIRGGISITLPFHNSNQNLTLWISHLIAAFLGLLGIYISGILMTRNRKQLIGKNIQLEKENRKRLEVEVELKKSESLYRDLVETTATIAWEIDLPSLKFTYISPRAEQLFGYPIEKWKDFNFWASHIHPEDKDDAISFCQTEREKGDDHEFEYRFLGVDNEIVWVRDIVSVISNADGRPATLRGYMLESTKQKLAQAENILREKRLQQTQKMDSLGTLAGGIAHDFNNILTPISGYVELALLQGQNNPQLTSDLMEVQNATARAIDMVRQILEFSRHDSSEASSIEIYPIVKEVLKLLRGSIPSTIEFVQNIDEQRNFVISNPTKIHQIVMNLCTNAYQAMKESGGILEVSLLPLDVPMEEIIQGVNLKPGKYLCLKVSDNGCGMNQATRERIFEPYFSSKGPAESTGLGLTVVHGIVKELEGYISVSSELGEGTTFHVFFPVEDDILYSGGKLSEETIPTGTERIMIVDDEERVGRLEKSQLIRQGYEVEFFTCPLEALDYFSTHPELFDLIITDMTMPKMTGDKLAQNIMKIRPDMPVILCSGFSDLINEEKAKAQGIKEYIHKPVSLKLLSHTLRNVLDGLEN